MIGISTRVFDLVRGSHGSSARKPFECDAACKSVKITSRFFVYSRQLHHGETRTLADNLRFAREAPGMGLVALPAYAKHDAISCFFRLKAGGRESHN